MGGVWHIFAFIHERGFVAVVPNHGDRYTIDTRTATHGPTFHNSRSGKALSRPDMKLMRVVREPASMA
jgi:hypothetical protein